MYAGHVAIAMGARRAPSAPPLWLLVLAAQGPDWGDALNGVLGVAPADPGWAPHGFPLVLIGITLTAALAGRLVGRRRGRSAGRRAALLTAVVYLSHWVVDWVTGIKPTWPGGPLTGLDWYSRPGHDLALESLTVLVGWAVWRSSPGLLLAGRRRMRDTVRQRAPGREPVPEHDPRDALAWALLATLLALQLGVDLVHAHQLGRFPIPVP